MKMIKVKLIVPGKNIKSDDNLSSYFEELDQNQKLLIRPFYPNRNKIIWTTDSQQADFITIQSKGGDCRDAYKTLKQQPDFKRFEKKYCIYVNDDFPDYLYDDTKCIKWVSQPSRKHEENKKHNITVIPLIMSDHFHVDSSFIEECRELEKEYEFGFIGNASVSGRSILSTIDTDSYFFENTSSLHLYSIKNREEKIANIKHYLKKIAKCKFVFCPRGSGSSSFRLYETMMVGSIPIITGMNDFPFKDSSSWNEFSIVTDLDARGLKKAAQQSRNTDYTTMRKNSINFWENKCKMIELYTQLASQMRGSS